MDLSIIIINYNTKELLQNCLESISYRLQNCRFEVILIDNASTDGSKEMLLKDYPAYQLIINSKNLGFAKAVNQGLRSAQGDYLLLLNPDTKLLEFNWPAIKAKYTGSEKLGIIGGQLIFANNKPRASFGHFPTVKTELIRLLALEGIFSRGRFLKYSWLNKKHFIEHKVDWVGGGLMLFKKQVLDDIGFFDEHFFLYLEDVDYCQRAKKQGYLILYWPKIKVEHWQQAAVQQKPVLALVSEARGLDYYFQKYQPKLKSMIKLIIKAKFKLQLLKSIFSGKRLRAQQISQAYNNYKNEDITNK